MEQHDSANDREMEARHRIVELANEMLAGRLSYFEGAAEIATLRHKLSGIPERDPDFDAFVLIESETDHLPLEAQRPLWAAAALKRLEPEFRRIEAAHETRRECVH